jgi:hypothetical protein
MILFICFFWPLDKVILVVFLCQIVWLKQFKKFKDKSSAIRSDTGVCRRLSKFIKRWRRPGQMLVVGKPEYKTIIEASMVSILLVCFMVVNKFDHCLSRFLFRAYLAFSMKL